MRTGKWPTWLLILVIAASLAGCAGGGASARGTATAVTDVASIAGKWTGLLELEGGRDVREDLVELTVDTSGAYRAVTARQIGMLDARGTVAVSDGKILLKGERGSQATGTLYTQQAQPQRALMVEGTTGEGRRFSLRFLPKP